MDQGKLYLKRVKTIIRVNLNKDFLKVKIIFIKLKTTNTQVDFLEVRKMEKEFCMLNKSSRKIRNSKK